jgi:hypothetical protein
MINIRTEKKIKIIFSLEELPAKRDVLLLKLEIS